MLQYFAYLYFCIYILLQGIQTVLGIRREDMSKAQKLCFFLDIHMLYL